MRKGIWAVMMVCLLMMIPLESEAAGAVFDTSEVDSGVIHVSYKAPQPRQLKVMVTKGQERYTYDLKSDGTVESFPLQMGNGSYKVDVLQNAGGNRYTFLDSKTFQVKLEDPNSVFLNSIQEIYWNREDPPIVKSGELIGNKTEVQPKVTTIYEYMIHNYTYDYDKIPTLTASYKPNIIQTYFEKKGICYDYASLMAAMKRSDGIPTKLVKGYTKHVDGYHAWNEVLLDGEWVIIDSTVDAVYRQGGTNYTMVKNPSEFTKVYEY